MYLLSNEAKKIILERLKNHACYYPFEDIRAYKHLLKMEDRVPVSKNLKEEYRSIFQYEKEQCQLLLIKHQTHENAEFWKEALTELDKTLLLFDK